MFEMMLTVSAPIFGLLFYFYQQKPVGHERQCAKLAIGAMVIGIALIPIHVNLSGVLMILSCSTALYGLINRIIKDRN